MQADQVEQIVKMFEYNLWANTEMIKLCSNLSEEQLKNDMEGVFGGIRPTLVHIIRSEGGYLRRVTGSLPWADDLDWEEPAMSDLLARAKLSGAQLIAAARAVNPEIRHDIKLEGVPYHFFNWTVLLQALYHGIEHRTQIKFVLTQLGIEHPELAAWDYMDSLTIE